MLLNDAAAQYDRNIGDEKPFELDVSERIVSHYKGKIETDGMEDQETVVSYNISMPMPVPSETDGSIYGQTQFDSKSKIDALGGSFVERSQLDNTELRENGSSHLTPSHHRRMRSRDISTHRDQLIEGDSSSDKTMNNDAAEAKHSFEDVDERQVD